MDNQTSTPGPSRLWRIIFALSLGLDLAVGGLVAGAFLRGHD